MNVTFDQRLGACPLCRSPQLQSFDHDAKGVKIEKCAACGLLFMNPQYTDAYLDQYYARYITPDEKQGTETQDKYRQKKTALATVAHWKQGGRFLAVGCGGGLELEIARDLGFTVEGYDVDPGTTREIAERLGVPVYSGDFLNLQLPEGSYDCVFLDQVLEHLKDPAAYLRRIHTLLKPDGVVYIGVPNLASLSVGLKTLLGRWGLKKRSRGAHYDTDHHLMYYRPQHLGKIMAKEFGFEILSVSGDPRIEISPTRYRLAIKYPALCSRFVVVARPGRKGAA